MSKNTEFDELTFENIYPDGIHDHYWTDARNLIILKQLQQSGFGQKLIVEIGCGRGVVLSYLRQHSLDVHGVELAVCSPYAGAEGFIDFGIDATAMPVLFREKFKTLMLLDVIEHIEEPVSFIKSLLTAYPNVEQVLFTVPARSEVWSNYDVKHGHYRRYDLEMSADVMQQIGFEIADNRHFFHLLYPPARLLAINKKNRKTKITAPQGFSKIVHRVLATAFKLESHLLPKSWKGTSILCRAVKVSKP